MTCKVMFPLIVTTIAIAILNSARADQPLPQGPPVTVIQAPAAPSAAGASEAAPPAGKLWRLKWLHWSKNAPPAPACAGCGSLDPDFACTTCERTWVFIFGSCREFYGERPHRPIDGYYPYH